MTDLISRQAIMKEFANFVRESNNSDFARTPTWNDAVSLVGSMPTAQPGWQECEKCIFKPFKQFQPEQPEITLESAIDYLHSIGWMQEHDRIMVEYAQPEIIRCKDCMHNGSYDTDCPIDWNGKEYCSFAERRTDG